MKRKSENVRSGAGEGVRRKRVEEARADRVVWVEISGRSDL